MYHSKTTHLKQKLIIANPPSVKVLWDWQPLIYKQSLLNFSWKREFYATLISILDF